MSRKWLVLLSLLLALGALWLAWLLISGDLGYEPVTVATVEDGPGVAGHAWRGAVHVHTRLSGDASGSLDAVVAAAAAADLDFLVVSEHTRALGARGRPDPGWREGVLVVPGEEISTTGGHLLALGVPPHPYALGPTPRLAFADIAELGGAAFIAHPTGGEESWRTGWNGAAGVEVVSLYSALVRADTVTLLGSALAYLLDPRAATARILRTPSPAIDLWDRRTSLSGERPARRAAALGSVDAHGPQWLGLPAYESAFTALQTIVWMDRPPEPEAGGGRVDAGRITDALIRGRSAIVQAAVGAAPGLFFVAEGSDGTLRHVGETVRWEPGAWTLRAGLGGPGYYTVVLYRDGEAVARSDGEAVAYPADEPGTYRVEVELEERRGKLEPGAPPWIVTNPIYLWPSAAIAASRIHRVPPLPLPQLKLDLLTRPGWGAQSDGGAHSALAAVEGGIAWDLRLPGPEAPEEGTFAAVAWRPEEPVDWQLFGGAGVLLDSEVPWRLAFMVWTRGPDGSEHAWERVVASGTGGRATPALWDQFRRVDPTGLEATEPGTLAEELDRITGAALLVTPERMKPGTEARIEVLRLGLF